MRTTVRDTKILTRRVHCVLHKSLIHLSDHLRVNTAIVHCSKDKAVRIRQKIRGKLILILSFTHKHRLQHFRPLG